MWVPANCPCTENSNAAMDWTVAPAAGASTVIAPNDQLITHMECLPRRSIMFYRGPQTDTFLRLCLRHPNLVTPCHQMLASGG